MTEASSHRLDWNRTELAEGLNRAADAIETAHTRRRSDVRGAEVTDDPRALKLALIAESVNALTRPFGDTQHLSHVDDTGTTHTAKRRLTHPSILNQLRLSVTLQASLTGGQDGTTRPHPASAPPPGMEAVEFLDSINADVRWWLLTLGQQPRGNLDDALRQLAGAVTDPDVLYETVAEIERLTLWFVRASRVYAGWDNQTDFRPHKVRCYMCGEKGRIRLHVDVAAEEATAVCLACRSTWDRSNIGNLVDGLGPADTEQVGLPAPRDGERFLGTDEDPPEGREVRP